MLQVKEGLLQGKIIAIVRGVQSKYIVNTVNALVEGGISCVEVTFNQSSEEGYKETIRSLELLSEHFSEKVLIGAGTVLTSKSVDEAASCGAKYIISPNVDQAVIERTKEKGLVSIPGALTPSEIMSAYNWGADILKLFPAGVFGTEYIKAIRAPISHVPMMAVGGISPDNIRGFFDIGIVGVGIGGKLVDTTAIEEGNFEALTKTALQYTDAIK